MRHKISFCKGNNRTIMSEESFVHYVLQEPYIDQKICKDFGIGLRIYNQSIAFYREKYKKELSTLRSNRHSNALKGNSHGKKDNPKVVLKEKNLVDTIKSLNSIEGTAKFFNTTEWFVKRNLEKYGLGNLLPKKENRPKETDYPIVEKLEFLVPGLAEKYKNYNQSPLEYFFDLYKAFLLLEDLVDFIKMEANAFSYYREVGKIEKNEICWSSNRFERKLSLILLQRGIHHQRQVKLGAKKDVNWLFDFVFPSCKLIVEVDGGYHQQEDTIIRDDLKSEQATNLGYTILRFSTDEVWNQTNLVADKISLYINENQIN